MTRLNQLDNLREMLVDVEAKFHTIQPFLGATTTLPEDFDLDSSICFLNSLDYAVETGSPSAVRDYLIRAFSWGSSPQGFDYWDSVYESLPTLRQDARRQIQVWAISASFSQLNNRLSQ